MKLDKSISAPKAPNLPMAANLYSQQQQNQLSDALRLYFNRLDGVIQTLLSLHGGSFLNFPHIAASDSTDQYATADNTATIVKWNTAQSVNGFTLNLDGSATCQHTGLYKIDYSLQLANTANAAHDVDIWLKTDGSVVADSATRFTIPARKSAGVPTYLVAYSSIVFPVTAGDSIWLYWATDKAYSTTGPVDGVYIEHLPAITSPYTRPASPSAIGSIVFVSNIVT